MVDVTTEIIIKCPVQKVSEYTADPDHAPEWYVNIHKAEWLTEKPLSINSQIAFKARFLGRDLSYVYEIAEYLPHRKLVMKTSNGPFPMETTYLWEELDGESTRMTLRNRGNPSGFSKWMAPLMSSMMKKANRKDLKKVKEILERME
ncbi:SRPBCC family protein [Rossellomorea sp. AcN35-11]|nr:SRPBCC family protein [Rossellomorea aquimaris]WJV29498.1 SRPBCC family protein [Rossellomorea sp. AcN35-11]